MRKPRKKALNAIGLLVHGVYPHMGAVAGGHWSIRGWMGGRYSPNKQRQLRKAFYRARQRGVLVQRAMTDAVLEVGEYA